MSRLAALMLCLAVSSVALAAECPAPPGAAAALSSVDSHQRFAYVKGRLQSGARSTQIWRWTWTGIWGATTVAQLLMIPLIDDPGLDKDNWVGAPFTAVSAVTTFFMAGTAIEDARVVAGLEPKLAEDPCGALAEAERAFAHSAADQAAARAWLPHVINFVGNAAFTLVLGLAFKRWESGLINGAAGLVGGEIMLWTQPWGLIDEWADYQQGKLPSAAAPEVKVTLLPTFGSPGLSLQLLGRF
jgi:hypothetical protein